MVELSRHCPAGRAQVRAARLLCCDAVGTVSVKKVQVSLVHRFFRQLRRAQALLPPPRSHGLAREAHLHVSSQEARSAMSAVGAGGAECVWFKHPTRCYALGAVTQRQGDKIVLRDLGAAPAVPGAGTAKPPEGLGGAGWLAPSSGPPGQGGGEGAGETHTVATVTTLACDPTHLLDVDDLATMNNLDEAPLLCLLERRLTSEFACAPCHPLHISAFLRRVRAPAHSTYCEHNPGACTALHPPCRLAALAYPAQRPRSIRSAVTFSFR